VLLTGIHLMRTGELECDLPTLAPGMDLPYVPELIERKAKGENELLGPDTTLRRRLEADVERLRTTLERARDESTLPDRPSSHDVLNDLVIRARLG
jgi:hypothetical protein